MKHIKLFEQFINEKNYELDFNEGDGGEGLIVTNIEDDEELATIDDNGKITWLVKNLPSKIKKNIEGAAEMHSTDSK
jgi:hypothetical protein